MTDHTPSPASESPTTAPSNDPTESESGSGSIDVLHVEPDSRSAELLGTFCERVSERMRVRSVDHMDAALSVAETADCVVTEQRLSDGSGVELVARLRRRGDGIPVVFHTTCRGADVERSAMDAGADAYFEKRSERGQYDHILERVRELVDGNGRRDPPTSATIATDADGSTNETIRSEE